MAEADRDGVIDSERQSNMSGQEGSDPEKDIMTTEPDIDIEKQAQGQVEPEKTAETVPERDPNIVEFDGPDDPDNPKNWNWKKKIAITASMGSMTFVVTFASSIFAVCLGPVSEEFNVGTVVAALGVCLFLMVCQAESHRVEPLS